MNKQRDNNVKIVVIVRDRGTEQVDTALFRVRHRWQQDRASGGNWGPPALRCRGDSEDAAVQQSGFVLWVNDSISEPQLPPRGLEILASTSLRNWEAGGGVGDF